MKKFRVLGLGLMLCLALSLGIVLTNGGFATAFAADSKSVVTGDLSVEVVTREIFGDQKIKSTEYLHNYDDSTDYIYVDFEDYGYAIFFKDTMEMLEYSPQGSLPFENTRAKRYYGGPTNYLQKEDDTFRNVATGDILVLNTAEATNYSSEMRSFLLNSNQELRTQERRFSDISINIEKESNKNSPTLKTNPPDINTRTHIIPTGGNGKLIVNSNYFTTNPTHGDNYLGGSYGNGNSGTCGPVAAQLLLTYNNYYNDRRIIENRFLNGFNDATNAVTIPERNPNLCADPTSMTRWTLGSRSEDTGANSYYSNVVTTIMPANTSGATVNQVRNGMRTLLGNRLANNQFTVNSDEKGWFFGWSPISSTPIKNQIDAERPLIIKMSSNLGGADHFVVGYGYEDYTYPATGNTYSGYVVHFGWQGDTNVWVNSSWCDGYVSLQINHIHDFVETGNFVGGLPEYRCSTCGHRTLHEIITTEQQLRNIANNPSKHYTLGNNITLANNWTPIPKFTGTLNGNNFAIKNMTISIPNTNYSSERYFGLFETLDGTISNLKVQNIKVSSSTQNSGSWVSIGGIVGRVLGGGTISNCTVSSSSGNFDVNRANSRAGGIAGDSFGTIINCTNNANIWSNGDMGGIVGINRSGGEVKNCTNHAEVKYWLYSTTERSIGGIVGYMEYNDAILLNNKNYGHVSAYTTITAKARMGTIAGHVVSFSDNNLNYGTSSANYTGSNNTYLFKQHGGRVGRINISFAGGSGTQSEPFLVSTVQHLKNLEHLAPTQYARLTKSITLSGSWTPIPTLVGTFDGRNYSINNMEINIPNTNYSSERYFGLFATLNGTITNLKVQNLKISSSTQNSGSWVSIGGIVGRVMGNGEISNCTASTSQSGDFDVNRANSRAGGIAGDSFGTITNCTNNADVWSNGDMGGIVGINRSGGTVQNCTNNGEVAYWLYSTTERSIGGIVGYMEYSDAILTKNKNYGYVNARTKLTAKARMGMIAGHVVTFDQTNQNYGDWDVPSGSDNTYLFRLYNQRVGRQG